MPATITHTRLMFAVVAALWGTGLVLLGVGGIGGGVTIGVLAYAISRGALHALDADHLSMIDNSTRRLLAQNRPTPALGLAFSLGHSTVVLAAGAAVVGGAHWIVTASDDGSQLARTLGLTGATVSAVYLLCVAVSNMPLLWRKTPIGHHHSHCPLTRLLSAPFGQIDRGWQVYLMGLLFGLGFDTASTISVLMLAAAATGAHPATLLSIPVFFTAAMTLGDSVNSALMLHVYRDADRHTPLLSKIIVGVSVASALVISAATIAGIGAELGWWYPATVLSDFDTSVVAYLLVGIAAAGAVGFGLRRVIVHGQQTASTGA